ncbi:hypothetical protein D1013_07280 [Euzebyella marina]|jgi:hypothetical protein|uniref:Trypsin-co-occurring domain-containing protein n=1 Tax=Euzebyella marina TaxID=1761453 RepID=A0A3G2L4L3_9FLAO|nr:trypco2 family protein [Euzebyella marina]AYN67178.1 hypothetical protein D1013_07280 [Euzebyella marina]
MKATVLLLFLIFCFFSVPISAQYGRFTEEERLRELRKNSEPIRLLVEDIRRAVYASEKDLDDCLPPFTSATITLEGTSEGEAGIELNLVLFKITSKKKKGKINKSVITFVRDTIFSPLMDKVRDESTENFNIIRNLIVSQAYSNCVSSTAIKELTSDLKDKTVLFNILEYENLENISDEDAEEIITEAFKTQKLEVEVSFVVEKESSISGEFKITPITGSLSGNLKRKNVQTVKVTFGKDPS